MIENKKCYVANFNITFPNEDNTEFEPLVMHLEDIFLPALQQRYNIKYSGSTFFFSDIEKVVLPNNDKAIVGLLVRDTQVEIKSVVDQVTQQINYKDDRYQTSPFSCFILLEKNHRGIIIKNQNGSPSMSNFNTIMASYLHKFVGDENRKIRRRIKSEKENAFYLPYAFVNIVGIPSSQNLKKEFEELKSISHVTFRVYPLNPSPDMQGAFSILRNQLHALQGSSSSITMRSLKNIKSTQELVADTKGKVDFVVEGKKENGTDAKITPETTTMQHEFPLECDKGPIHIAQQLFECVEHNDIGELMFANEKENMLS